jgi:thiamine biosynthesis lipoprotein
MGTNWTVQLYPESRMSPAAVEALVQARLDQVISQMSGWEPGSDLCRFGAAPAGSWQVLPEPFLTVLREALAVAERSGGAFDPAMGALADLWGFGPSGPRCDPPEDDEIATAIAPGGWRTLRLEGGRLLQPGGVRLDFSGIAKGFAVDHVADALEAAGCASYLVEIGGELRGAGIKGDGTPWWVALEAPPGAALEPLTVALFGLSVATSGDYRRGFDFAGRRYGHTLDPRTGRPTEGLAAVAVLHPCCMTADALATAIGVLGPTDGLAFAEREGVAARVVAYAEDGFAERLTAPLQAMLD